MKRIAKRTLVLVIALCMLFSVCTAPVSAKDNAEIVKGVLRSQVVFDDFAKLTEAVRSGDGSKIFMCVLEIYPDFVAAIKKQLPDDPTPPDGDGNGAPGLASIISIGDIMLFFALTAIGSAAVGVAVTYAVMKKKQGNGQRRRKSPDGIRATPHNSSAASFGKFAP